ISYGSELHTFGCSFESGEISGNSAPVGGGLYLFDGEFVMIDQAIISGNTAVTNGGGVSIKENAKFVLDGGNINNNTATAKDSTGGGIDNAGQLSILGGNISGNTADFSIGFNGGGIANLGGEFELDGIAEIADIIYLDYDFAITLTSYPTENTFSVFLTDWTIEEAVIEGGVSVDAGLSFGNFSIINPNMVLRASIDSKNIIVKTALSITFDKNSTEAIGSMSKQYVLEGETFALSANSFIRDKYFFLGWATTSGGTVAYGDETQYIMGASDTTLYAKWQKTVPSWQDNGYMAEAFDGGDGSAETPYLIADASQLAYLASLVNAGVPDYSSKHYKLTADIDLSIDNFPDLVALGVQKIIWIAIGNPENSFLGSFDGDGYVISGIDVDLGEDTSLYHGLFGMTYAADIKNLGIRGINIVGEAEDVTIGSIVAMAIETLFINVFVEDITANITLDAGYFGGIVGNGSGVAIQSFYVNSAGDGIVLNGTPSVGGTFSAAAAGMASIGYVHISGLEETLYLASGQEDLFSDTAFDKLYYTSVSYNASALKTGNELRLYRWVDVPGNYPTLEKIVLRSTVTLSCMALPYSLGQEIVGSFDEAILSLAKDGNIIIGRENYISENELWTLPEEIFGTAYITSWSEYYYYSAYIFVESGATLTLRNIDITNNALDDTIYMFSVDGVLNILEGTTIAGKAIITSTSIYLTDSDTNGVSLGGIAMTENVPVVLEGQLYSQLVFDEFLDNSTVVAGDGISVTDASIYLWNCTLTWPGRYHLQADGDIIRGYAKKIELYFDITAADGGNGDELAPVNNLEMIKALAAEDCIVFVMSTIDISIDTVWDFEGYIIDFTNYPTFSGALFNVVGAELTLKQMCIYMTDGVTVFLDTDASLVLDETIIYYHSVELTTAIVVSPTAHLYLGLSCIIAYIQLQNDGVSSGKVIISEETGMDYFLYIEDITENQLPVVETDNPELDLTESFSYFMVDSTENRLMLVNDEVNNTINIKIQEYSVTFYDKEGGSAYGSETAQAPQTVQIYELAMQPLSPLRLGYEFEGWRIFDGTEYITYNFDNEVVGDINIVAFWYNYFGSEDAEGTEESPFVISEFQHLANMSYLFSLESGVERYDVYKDKYYILANNIIAGEGFVMIGNQPSEGSATDFHGTFDGNGYVIRNLIYNSLDFAALFLSNYGTIKNLGIEGAMSGFAAAAFTIFNSGIIMNCYSGVSISAASYGAGIAVLNYDGMGDPFDPDFDPDLVNNGEIINCYNFGAIERMYPEEPAMLAGITTILGSVIGCYNAAGVQGSPIAVDALLISNCYFNRDYYEDEAGFYTLSMVGETTATHQNLLYNALEANAPGVWSQPSNDGHTWYYPQIKIFYDNGNYIYCETVYTIEIDFQNGEPNAIEYAVMCGYAPLPVEPEKTLYLFDGWTLDGGDFDFEIDTINGDLYIVARWAIYQLIFDETGLRIIGITIAEGQENVEVTIPDFITHIEIYAFMDKYVISSVIFAEGSSLVQINIYAFFNTYITELALPSSIISIFNGALGGMPFLESISVGEGALNHKTQDGVLYNADMTTLLFYPLNKSATHFEIPASVTRINDYAFYDSNYQGNANLQSIVLPDGLNEMGNVGLYGLSNLVSVTINNIAPLFTPDANVFRYFDTTEWLKKINDNLVIELPSYTAYTNYMSDSGWDDFDGYYSYPILVTFNYQGATERNTETTRTTVDGIVDGDIIYNGMAMGTMPTPLYFGKNFLAWNTASDGTGDALMADTLLYADTQAYALWFDWGGVVLTNGEGGEILVNGEEHSGKSVSDIIAVDEVYLVYFDNFAAAEQINIVDKAVSLVGSVSLDFDGIPLFISGSSAVYIDFDSVATPSSIVYILSGSDGTYVTYVRGDLEHAFLQSPDIDIGLYPDYAAVPYPGEGNNILCWNVAGNIGRNQQTMYYEDLPTEYTYSPVVAPKVYITDTTTDYTYNATARSVTYTTDKFLFDGECDITYFATDTDMLSRINPIAVPKYVGAYYYVISREGRDDYCDITDLSGSYTIVPAEVLVETSGSTTVSKVFDGYSDYEGAFEEGTYYLISGIFDDATISIISITFNSIHTDALYVTVEISISDTHNYTVNDSFDCYAVITPLDIDISWDMPASYVYTGEDQGASVQPSYYDVYGQKIELDVAFSGQDPVFKTAGTYTATALTGDDDYAFAYTTAELTIEQAEVTVSPAVGAYLSKVFDDDSYFYDTIDQDIHYIVEGIVDGSTVSITGAEYESMNVGEALTVDVDYEIIGGENYSYTGAFTLLGEITPRNSIAEWSLSVPYTYNGSDQSGEVSALFYDYYGDAVPLAVTFTGRDSVFKYAGTYLATATNIDSNYNVTNYLSNLEMQKAEVSVLSVGETTLTKVYDGDNVYYGDIVLDEHYTVSGLVDDAKVTIESAYFNSSKVAYANEVTISVAISDTDNYTINDGFVYGAYISPFYVDAEWLLEDNYVYNGADQASSVGARYTDIDGMYAPLYIEFSGESTQFSTAGEYTATAINYDTNYYLTNVTADLVIDKADAIILGSIQQEHTYDGIQKDVAVGLNHTETTLTFAPEQGYTDAGNYEITVSAAETHNYLPETLVVILIIYKADYEGISHDELYGVYTPGLTLADITMNDDFYWTQPETLIYAGETQSFGAYYNADFDNYESYELLITVSIEKAAPVITNMPVASSFIAGRELSNSALSGGTADIPGAFSWRDGSEIISTAGLNTREAAFTPEDTDNYYSAIFNVDVVTHFLRITFASYEHESVFEVTYNAEIAVLDFPQPAQKTGYDVAWEIQEDIVNIVEDATVNAVYTLLNPEVEITGYTQPVTYGTVVTLMAEPWHALSSAAMSYEWYYGEEPGIITTSNFVILTQVAESGSYKVIITADDGEQQKTVEAMVEVVINRASALITAEPVQEHTYNGEPKEIVAELNHSETELIYAPAQGYTEANEEGYLITVSAAETDNYLATQE
ncbi:MAG: InlB B-repeat-containing protein, partial [Clostridia bacterium]|nr:InlB B-repeat-containing protein [Clostridia bacterium]